MPATIAPPFELVDLAEDLRALHATADLLLSLGITGTATLGRSEDDEKPAIVLAPQDGPFGPIEDAQRAWLRSTGRLLLTQVWEHAIREHDGDRAGLRFTDGDVDVVLYVPRSLFGREVEYEISRLVA